MAEFNIEGLLGNVFGGGGGNYLDEYLTEDQRRMMQRNAMLAASAALLKAGGESTRRIGIGEALGSAFEAGQAGYEKAQTSALTQMALKQKLDEAKLDKARELAFEKLLKRQLGEAPPPAAMQTAVTPEALPQVGDPYLRRSIIDNPERREDQVPMGQMQQMYTTQADLDALKNYKGPQVQLPRDLTAPLPTALPVANRQFLSPDQVALLRTLPRKEAAAEMLKFMQPPKTVGEPFKGTDGNTYVRTEQGGVIPFTTGIAPQPVGQAQAVMMNGKPVLMQAFSDGTRKEVKNEQPYEALPTDIRGYEYISGSPLAGRGAAGIRDIGVYRNQATPKTVVEINQGQPGYENEMKLASAFRGEPIVKEFSDMRTAYGQVISSLDQGTPIGDVAGATKVMKLLDPGSVVRESELGIAMAAAGRMDRLQNYFNNLMTGQKLTPTQRQDFKALSNELYAAAGQAYNQKRNDYLAIGQTYKFPNINTILGTPATVPSIVRQPGGSVAAPGMGGGRPTLNNIFGAPGN